jgi:hypothetical protein
MNVSIASYIKEKPYFIHKDHFQSLINDLLRDIVDLDDEVLSKYSEIQKLNYILFEINWKCKFDPDSGHMTDLDFSPEEYNWYNSKMLNTFFNCIAPYVNENCYMIVEYEEELDDKVIFRNNKFYTYEQQVFYHPEEIVDALIKKYGESFTLAQIMEAMKLKEAIG